MGETGFTVRAAATNGRLETADGVVVRWEMRQSAEDRRTLSRELLRRELTEILPGGHSLVQQCATCGGTDHGRLRVEHTASPAGREASAASAPSAPPLVSVSYAGSLTVVGVAPPGSRRFGIDVEWDTSERQRAAREALESPADGADPDHSLRAWTRLEAIAKARGRGLRGGWERPDATGLTCTALTIEFGSHADGPDPGANPSAILSIALS